MSRVIIVKRRAEIDLEESLQKIQHHQTKHGQKEKNGGENPKHAYLKDYKNLVTQNPDDPKINNIATKISL